MNVMMLLMNEESEVLGGKGSAAHTSETRALVVFFESKQRASLSQRLQIRCDPEIESNSNSICRPGWAGSGCMIGGIVAQNVSV